MYVWQRWMPEEFRKAGLTVVEVEGWENRGRPASTGQYNPIEGVTNHHTGSTTSASNTHPTLRLLIEGRPDLPGPLAPWTVGYDGVVYVLAAGRCNHAGRVGKRVPYAAFGVDGNAIFMGDEIDTNGTQTMPQVQREAVAMTNAVYSKRMKTDLERVHRHEDISGTGKWDLGSMTTPALISDARAALKTLEKKMVDNAVTQGRARISAGVTEVSAGIRVLWTVPKSRRAVWVMARAAQIGNQAIRAALKVGPKS